MHRRVLRAIGAEGLGQFLNIGIRILLVPLFLSAWGGEGYGEWLIFTAVAAWFGIADLGGQLYFINRMTETWAQKKFDEFQDFFSTGMILFCGAFTVLIALVTPTIIFLDVPEWLGAKITSSETARWVLILMCLKILASLPLGLVLGVFRATGSQATGVMYGNLMLLIQLTSGAAVLSNSGGMVLMALTEVLALLFVSCFVILDLHRRMPREVQLFQIRSPSKKILREAWIPSLHFLGIQLSMAVMIQGSVIVVAKAMGPFEVAIFSTMRTIANLVSRLLGMMSHSAWPEFTRLHSQKNSVTLQKLFCSISFASTLAGLLYIGIVYHFGATLFELWLGQELPYETTAMFLMATLVVFTNNWTLGGNLLMATNQHRDYARIQLPVNVFALVLAFAGGHWLGLEGIIGGLLLGQSAPMLCLTAWLLRQHGWGEASRYLEMKAIFVLALLPLFLSEWGALLGTLLFFAQGVREFWLRNKRLV